MTLYMLGLRSLFVRRCSEDSEQANLTNTLLSQQRGPAEFKSVLSYPNPRTEFVKEPKEDEEEEEEEANC